MLLKTVVNSTPRAKHDQNSTTMALNLIHILAMDWQDMNLLWSGLM